MIYLLDNGYIQYFALKGKFSEIINKTVFVCNVESSK